MRLEASQGGPPVVSYAKLCRDVDGAAEVPSPHLAKSVAVQACRQSPAASLLLPHCQPPEGDAAVRAVDEDGSVGEEEEELEEEADDGGSGSDSEASAGAAGDGYDCEDGFIDDAELDDPQEVLGEAKHDGFFINKARLRVVSAQLTIPLLRRETLSSASVKKGQRGPQKSEKQRCS